MFIFAFYISIFAFTMRSVIKEKNIKIRYSWEILSVQPIGYGVCNNFMHFNSNSCLRLYLYI